MSTVIAPPPLNRPSEPGLDMHPLSARVFNHPDELVAAVGQYLGASDWIQVDQSRIDLFADATLDHQWVHVDPERAQHGPFGACIAHGYLTLALGNFFLPQRLRQNPLSGAGTGRLADSRHGRIVACRSDNRWRASVDTRDH